MTTKKEATRLRLLEAGMDLAIKKGAQPHIDIRLTEVLAEVGLTTGAAYNIWDSQDDFRADLAIEVAGKFSNRTLNGCGSTDTADVEQTASVALHSVETAASLSDYVRLLASSLVATNRDDMTFFLPLRFAGVRSVPESIKDRIREGYARSDASFASIIVDICDRFDLTIADGRTIEGVSLLAVACVDGILVRKRLTADAGNCSNASEALAKMLYALLQDALVPKTAPSYNSQQTHELSQESALAS